MNLRRAFGTVAGLALAAAGMAGLSGPAWAAPPIATPTTCTFQTFNTGNYLTAVGGGGRTTDVIHSDATQARSWELFRLQCGLTTVPNVQGFDDGGARNSIAGAGLTVGAVTFDNTCVDVRGTVLFSSPGAGATVARGSAVNLTESSGVDRNGRPCVLK
ncbi:PASTA domain-containing protein [Nonomuraea sp. NPDC052265]|uniref:PASTA domain-containing protein n=1 Tax=Nonomuraea sp. NPDC052265 TaxID=3364374 RepID=UPI0037C61241